MLFDENPRVLLKTETSKLVIHKNFLTIQESKLIFEYFKEIDFELEEYTYYGKSIKSKKKSTAFGSEKFTYSYSGINRTSQIWSSQLENLAIKISNYIYTANNIHGILKTVCPKNLFNFVLCNLYSDGQAAVGWHSDDESIINQSIPIASISLGQSRIFEITRNYKNKTSDEFNLKKLIEEETYENSIQLDDGDLLIMYGNFQTEFLHRLKKDSSKNPRINLTFRSLQKDK